MAASLSSLYAVGELGEKGGGAGWKGVRLGRRSEFFLKGEAHFAQGSFGRFKRVRIRGG